MSLTPLMTSWCVRCGLSPKLWGQLSEGAQLVDNNLLCFFQITDETPAGTRVYPIKMFYEHPQHPGHMVEYTEIQLADQIIDLLATEGYEVSPSIGAKGYEFENVTWAHLRIMSRDKFPLRERPTTHDQHSGPGNPGNQLEH